MQVILMLCCVWVIMYSACMFVDRVCEDARYIMIGTNDRVTVCGLRGAAGKAPKLSKFIFDEEETNEDRVTGCRLRGAQSNAPNVSNLIPSEDGNSVLEGATATFTITRSGSGTSSTVYVNTIEGTADGSDYEGLTTTAVFFNVVNIADSHTLT